MTEVFALTTAYILSKGEFAFIYTDSRNTFGVVNDFGMMWKQVSTHLVFNLLGAVLLLTELEIIINGNISSCRSR